MGVIHTTHGLASLLYVSERQINRWADAGEIPVILLPNGERRFDGDAVRAWLQSRSQPFGTIRISGGLSEPINAGSR